VSGTVLLGVLLGLLSSVLFNTSYLIQHKALDGEGPSLEFASAPLRSIKELLSAPLWLLGGVIGIGGMVVYIVALSYAPLSLVQAFLAGGLILTVPLAAVIGNHKPTSREITGAALMTLALVLFAFGTKAEGPTNHYDMHGLAFLVGVAGTLGVLLAWRGTEAGPVELVGLAAGLFYGASDALFNALVGIAHHGAMALIKSPWTYICLITAIGAFVCLQRAFKEGQSKPVGVIALMTAATNVTAIGAGILVFHDPLGTTQYWETVHVIAFMLVVVAGWLLASAQAVVEEGGSTAETSQA
jgi:drug/metabolite transporter (DMT)-like permease